MSSLVAAGVLAPAPQPSPPLAVKAKPNAFTARLDFACSSCGTMLVSSIPKTVQILPAGPTTERAAAKLAERFAGSVDELKRDDHPGDSMGASTLVARTEPASLASAGAGDGASVGAAGGRTITDGSARDPIMSLTLQRSPRAGARTQFPFQVAATTGRVFIGRVPEGVYFTRGERSGDGLWMLDVGDVTACEMLVGAAAPASFTLTFMLLNAEGTVISGIDMAVGMRDVAEPATSLSPSPALHRVPTARAARTAKLEKIVKTQKQFAILTRPVQPAGAMLAASSVAPNPVPRPERGVAAFASPFGLGLPPPSPSN